MADVKKDEISQLKKDVIDLIESRREERELMIEVISSLNLLAAGHEDILEKTRQIKEGIVPEGEISFEFIRSLSREIKDTLIAEERISGEQEMNEIDLLTERFIESCRIMKRLMAVILEDFYPMSDDMKKAADLIRVECKGDPVEIDIKKPSEDFLDFIQKIKIRISKDFTEINNTFFDLLNQVKELEKSLASDFDSESSVRNMENFESNINEQVGNITESFDSYTTINELKEVVIGKLKNIKDLVSLKKKEEIEKARAARENMKRLNQRINTVEKKVHQMSAKAKKYQKAAMKDGLTGLFSRGAFDARIREAFENFTELKKEFSIIVFDVDKF